MVKFNLEMIFTKRIQHINKNNSLIGLGAHFFVKVAVLKFSNSLQVFNKIHTHKLFVF